MQRTSISFIILVPPSLDYSKSRVKRSIRDVMDKTIFFKSQNERERLKVHAICYTISSPSLGRTKAKAMAVSPPQLP